MRGVEIGGAAKNVLAIACGAVAGQGLGESAKAALIARGFAELLRFARAYGGEAETLMGLSGLGDLVLTCSSAQSRNFAFGQRLGQGLSVEEAAGGKLVEGAATASALVALARAKNIDMPIAEAVDQILSGAWTLDQAVDALMNRPDQVRTRKTNSSVDGPLALQIRTLRLVLGRTRSPKATKGTHWNGVRNHVAKQNLMAMKKGEQGFFYHSNEGKAVVGIVEVIREYYPDHTDETGKFGMVDIKAVKPLPKPVTLDDIKKRAAAQGHDPRQQFPPLGAAGDGRGMGAHLQDGRALRIGKPNRNERIRRE